MTHPLDAAAALLGIQLTAPAQVAQDVTNTASRELATMSRAHDTDVQVALSDQLYPFQRAGVAYAIRQRRVLIGDEMGLGKTRQAISAIETTGARQAVIVCPASLKSNWAIEILKLVPSAKVYIASGRTPNGEAAAAARADYLIVNYDILTGWAPSISAPQSLVLDESHYAKNPEAQRTQAALTLSKRIPADGLVLLLTGTPVLNRPIELLTQLTILGRVQDVVTVREPRKGQTREQAAAWAFKFAYCAPEKVWVGRKYVWQFNGATNLAELNSRMRAVCYVRRLKSEVLTELPAKLPQIDVPLALNGKLDTYRRAEADFISFVADTKGRKAAAKASKAEAITRLNGLRKLAGEAKIEAATEWVTNWLDSNPGQKVIVFALHIEVQHALVERFSAPAILGGQSSDKTEAAKREFQEGAARVIVLSQKAAREGHTLTAASTVVFVELGWTPGEHQQAEDRAHRIGQTQDVQPYYLLAAGTIDERMVEVLTAKRAVVRAVADGVVAPELEESVEDTVLASYGWDD